MDKNWNDIGKLELGTPVEKVQPDSQSNADNKHGSLSLEQSQNHPHPKRALLRSFTKFLFKLILIFVILGLLAAAGGGYMLYHWAAADLPSFSRITDYTPKLVTTVLARDGSYMGQLYHERRFLVTLDQLPSFVPKAFLAIEDDQFYSHPGISIKAIIRAAISNFNSGGAHQGGSTITQQVVKRLMLTPEKSYERKLKEAILAYRLEQQLTKDRILTLYINQIFLGSNSYGVEAAARTFFAKNSKDLTIAEAALIAGLGQSPSSYNPYRNPKAAIARQHQVLRRMRDLGWISDSEYDQAVNQKLEFKSLKVSSAQSGWYFEEVRRQLVDMFSEEKCKNTDLDFGIYGEDAVYELGLTVHTAMDPIQQEAANNGLRQGLEEATRRHGWLGAPEHIEPSQYSDFLSKKNFSMSELDNGGWTKALVISTEKNGVIVQLSPSITGVISSGSMTWARKPHKYARRTASKDNNKIAPGDVIWVSRADGPAKSSDKKEDSKKTRQAQQSHIALKLQQIPRVQGAMVSIEPETGDVVAMVGGYSFGSGTSQFNRATQALRQPGSSFKPIVYSAALDHGFNAASMVLDAPISFYDKGSKKTWSPGNSDGKFLGPMPLWQALAKSRNLCTIRMAQIFGLENVIARAKAMQLQPDFPMALPICLGAVEVLPINMAQAYTAFANEGKVSKPRLITKIIGPWGNEIYHAEPEHVQAISPQNAFVMATLLKGVVNYGTGAKAKVLGRPLGGKTGTTNDEKDAWFMAVSPHLVTATYIGYDQPEPMGRGETGSGAALPAYIHYAKKGLAAYPPDDFKEPPDIVYADAHGMRMPFEKGKEPGTGYGHDAMQGIDPALKEQVSQGEDLLKDIF